MAMRFRMTLKPWPVAKPCCTRTFHRTKCTPCTGEFLLDSSPPTQIPRVHVCSSRSRLTMIPCKGCSMPTSPTGIPRNASHISMLVMNTHMLRSDSTSSLWHALSERFFMQRVSRHHARYSTGLRPWRHLLRLEMKSRSHPCRWDLHASVSGLRLGRLAVLPVRLLPWLDGSDCLLSWTYAACGRLDYSRYGNRCSVVTESFIALRLTDSIGLSHVRKLEETL